MMKGQSLLISALVLFPVAFSASLTGNLGATVSSEMEVARLVRRERYRDQPLLNDGELAQNVKYCDTDFVLGKDAKNECEDADNHTLMTDRKMCVEAAREASATANHSDFEIDQLQEVPKNSHPKGCFFMPCARSNDTSMSVEEKRRACYFYNGVNSPRNDIVIGRPVCSRKKYMKGKPRTNGGDGKPNCPEGYTTLNSEPLCGTAANCLGDAAGPQFRIGQHNASKHLDFSAHCFIDGTGANKEGPNEVFYNNPDSGMTRGGSKTGADGAVLGTPICVVKSSVAWSVENDEPKLGEKAINDIVKNNTDQSTHKDTHGVLNKTLSAM